MKSNKTEHIASRELKLLVGEQLDSDQESKLISHIDDCADCQSRLEKLVENGSEWSAIQPYLVELDPEAPDECSIRALLDLLGPTDYPDMLGRLGQYEVVGVIGTGTTGIVVKAFERSLNRFVAIKVLHPQLCVSSMARKRFDREGRAIAAVVNPHVVPVFAISEHAGHPFIVMQYMPGGSLQQRISRDGQLAADEVVRLGLHIAEGLEAAHAQGVVHRDVKPANVMLESGLDRAMVSDFGLARVTSEASMTCSGLITGTPEYMSPEQARGETLDGRSDLFGLGSTLYAACAGHSPFRAANVFGVIKRVCDEQPRSILESNPAVPTWLVDFIDVLMSKAKENRFQSAAEVKQQLAAELAHMQSPNTVSRPSRPWQSSVTQKKRTALVLGSAALLAFLVGGWLFAKPLTGILQGANAAVGVKQEETKAEDKSENKDELSKAISRLLVDSGAPLQTFDFTKAHSIPVREGGSLVLRSELADVVIETHDKPRVEIESVISIAARNRKQAEALFRTHAYGKDLKGNDLVEGRDALLVSEWGSIDRDLIKLPRETVAQYLTRDKRLSIGRVLASNDQSNVSMRVKVPRKFSLRVSTAEGKVTVPSIEGAVDVVANDGNVTLGDTRGEVRVYVEDGSLVAGSSTGDAIIRGEDVRVEIESVGRNAHFDFEDGEIVVGNVGGDINVSAEDAIVRIGQAWRAAVTIEDGRIGIGKASRGVRLKIKEDGDIHVGEVGRELQASTGEGKITVEHIGRINTDSTVTTKKGAIRIGVNRGASVAIKARSAKGKIRGGLVPEAKAKANSVDIKSGDGGATLLLQTKRSPIQIDEVDSPWDPNGGR